MHDATGAGITMSAEEHATISAKIDGLKDFFLKLFQQEREDRIKCRDQDDGMHKDIWDAHGALRMEFDKLKGGLGVHHWLVFTAELGVLAAMLYFGVRGH